MINPENMQSVINHLSTDKNNPVTVLAYEKYGNSFLILYSDSVSSQSNQSAPVFSVYTKHRLYKNRYQYKGGTTGEQTRAMVAGMELTDEADGDYVPYAIANAASDETKCSLFEADFETGLPIKRLDVIDVPGDEPYIIVKEYKKESENNLIYEYDGEIELSDLTEDSE